MKSNKTTTILIIIVALLGVVYLFKDKLMGLFSGGSNRSNEGLDVIPSPPISSTDQTPISEPYANTVIKYGSEGEAVSRTQKRMNMLIDLCKNAYDSKNVYPNMNSTTAIRVNKIAQWSKLSTDGKFGSKTKDVVKYVMSTDSTTLNKVREKYKNFEYVLKTD